MPSIAGSAGISIPFRPGWPEVEDARLRLFLQHWAAARRGRIVAAQSAIGPAAIAPCLPNVFMYRYLPERRDFVLTLSGEEINAFWREPLKGRSMREVLGNEAGELAVARGLLVVHTPALLYTQASTITRPDALYAVTRLTAPLLKDDGEVFGTIGISLYAREPHENRRPDEVVSLHDCSPLKGSAP
jgi:hypothetical protein